MNERLANEIKELLTPPDTSEFVEAWQGFLRRHIEPSRLFEVSQDMADPTPDEMKHLCNCVPCRTAYDSYRASSILHKRDETIVELRAKLAEREAAAGAKDKALAEARSRIIAMLENGHWRNGYTDATGTFDEGETGTARFVDEVVRQIDAALDGSTGRTFLAEREAERAELETLRARLAEVERELAEIKRETVEYIHDGGEFNWVEAVIEVRHWRKQLAESRATCEAWERLTANQMRFPIGRKCGPINGLSIYRFGPADFRAGSCVDAAEDSQGYMTAIECLAALDAQQGKADSGTNEKGE